MVQKNTGSGISTPANKSLSASLFCLRFFSSSLPARRAAANALDLDETMVSPVAVCKQRRFLGIKKGCWQALNFHQEPWNEKKFNVALSFHQYLKERQICKGHYNNAQVNLI